MLAVAKVWFYRRRMIFILTPISVPGRQSTLNFLAVSSLTGGCVLSAFLSLLSAPFHWAPGTKVVPFFCAFSKPLKFKSVWWSHAVCMWLSGSGFQQT